MTPEVSLANSVEVKRSKRLKGQPALQGDAGLGFQALLLGALAEGASKLENLPDTPWFREALDVFVRLGYAQQALDGHWLLHGSSAPVTEGAPLRVRGETDLMILAGFLVAKGCRRVLEVDAACVSQETMELLARIFVLEAAPEPETPEAADEPRIEAPVPEESWQAAEPAHFNSIVPTGLQKKAADLLSPGGATRPKLADFGWDEYLAKLALLSHQLAAGGALDLSLLKSGPDVFETLAAHFGAPLRVDRNNVEEGDELARRIARQLRAAGKQEPETRLRLGAGAAMQAQTYSVPSDVTQTAAYCLAATLLKGSDVTLEGVLLNPSRAAFLGALRRMGADIEAVTRRERFGEGVGVVRVRSTDLLGKRFGAENIAGMRDEVFLLMVAAAFAEGETIIRDVGHLRRHRADLLKGFAASLKAAGVEIGEIEDGLVIRGRPDYDGGVYDCMGHPGLALACLVMALKSHGASTLENAECLEARYPGMTEQLFLLAAGDKPAPGTPQGGSEKTEKTDKAGADSDTEDEA
jgi:5-enolpyruvylshikimate-3-phosphate synthase